MLMIFGVMSVMEEHLFRNVMLHYANLLPVSPYSAEVNVKKYVILLDSVSRDDRRVPFKFKSNKTKESKHWIS